MARNNSLEYCCSFGVCSRGLLVAGADINRGDALGQAITWNHPEIAQVLLGHGADLAGRHQPDELTYLGYAQRLLSLRKPNAVRPSVWAAEQAERAQILDMIEKQLAQNRSSMM